MYKQVSALLAENSSARMRKLTPMEALENMKNYMKNPGTSFSTTSVAVTSAICGGQHSAAYCNTLQYGVASISRLLKIIGLFCRI